MSAETHTEPETVREAWKMACPKCGRDDEISVSGTTWMRLTPNGTQADQADHEWDNDSTCWCCACGYAATVRDFDLTLKTI